MRGHPLRLFYAEPDPDRWLPLDRYPRRLVRRLVRGDAPPGGHRMVFLNLCAGLDRLGVAYRANDFRGADRHPEEPACIIGKPHLLDARRWRNPILFGAAVHSHPIEDPRLLERLPVRMVLVPGEWMRRMYEPYYGDRVRAWPVGIDTDLWVPGGEVKSIDILIYDKVRWEHDRFEAELIGPVRDEISRRGLRFETIRYGHYRPDALRAALGRARAMVFLCEHETQGLAYQQALASGVPILAWDRGGFWQDPSYFPDRVRFEPVTSVPYWDQRCGDKFSCAADFGQALDRFWDGARAGAFRPRDYILENLTLEKCARHYLELLEEAMTI